MMPISTAGGLEKSAIGEASRVHQSYLSVEPLRQFVIGFTAIIPQRTEETREIRNLPDGTSSLLFRIDASGRADMSAVGLRTRALYKKGTPHALTLGVRFKPGGAYPFFGDATQELTDRIVALKELWRGDGSRLCEALLRARDVEQMARIVQTALVQRLQRHDLFEPTSARIAQRAAQLMARSPKFERMAALADALGLSTRHLRRTFRRTVGVAPKEFARIVRFQRVIDGLRRRQEFSALAADAGYYDQAHMIGEFRSFAGTTPGAFAERERLQT